jgi:hypothetical protein
VVEVIVNVGCGGAAASAIAVAQQIARPAAAMRNVALTVSSTRTLLLILFLCFWHCRGHPHLIPVVLRRFCAGLTVIHRCC